MICPGLVMGFLYAMCGVATASIEVTCLTQAGANIPLRSILKTILTWPYFWLSQ